MTTFKMSWWLLGAWTASLVFGSAQPAFAIAQFKKEFEAKYVKKAPTTTEEKSLAAAVGTVKCNVCHKGKTKKEHTQYGEALGKLLDRKMDKADKAKIRKALETVEAQPSKPGDPNSPTFGALLKQGKLPGDDCVAPPAMEEEESEEEE
jgi:hypothetical protein